VSVIEYIVVVVVVVVVIFFNLGLISNLMHKILIYLHIIHLLKSSTCF